VHTYIKNTSQVYVWEYSILLLSALTVARYIYYFKSGWLEFPAKFWPKKLLTSQYWPYNTNVQLQGVLVAHGPLSAATTTEAQSEARLFLPIRCASRLQWDGVTTASTALAPAWQHHLAPDATSVAHRWCSTDCQWGDEVNSHESMLIWAVLETFFLQYCF